LPGTDPYEAARVVFGELPDLPHLPELPARGAGADMIGRGTAILVDLPVDLQPAGWRLVERPGRDWRRARDFLRRDLDALEEVALGYQGPVKIQVAGPWTLAATVELGRGDKALSDGGAVRDLAASLAEGVTAQLADLRARVPAADPVVQVDEPLLPAVLAGTVPTASGFGALRAVEPSAARGVLATVLGAAANADVPALVHCCAARSPIDLLGDAGADGLGLDVSRLTARDDDAIGAAVEAGRSLFLGVVPATDPEVSDRAGTVAAVRVVQALWHRLGLDATRLAGVVVPTPACGLAGASPAYARSALARCREIGRRLREDPEG
jgi:methionine synthase II (cobalamin-independent)